MAGQEGSWCLGGVFLHFVSFVECSKTSGGMFRDIVDLDRIIVVAGQRDGMDGLDFCSADRILKLGQHKR